MFKQTVNNAKKQVRRIAANTRAAAIGHLTRHEYILEGREKEIKLRLDGPTKVTELFTVTPYRKGKEKKKTHWFKKPYTKLTSLKYGTVNYTGTTFDEF